MTCLLIAFQFIQNLLSVFMYEKRFLLLLYEYKRNCVSRKLSDLIHIDTYTRTHIHTHSNVRPQLILTLSSKR